MKINVLRNGGRAHGGLTDAGGTLSNPLLLSRHPQLSMEASTKQYVDQGIQSLNANNFTTGILPIARLPAMSGDVTSVVGSNVINLIPTGVTAGGHARVIVNAKGLITGTEVLSEAHLPNLPFSKITTGRPTTLAGYGITDAVNVNGSIMTGPLILANDPVSNSQLVTKRYIDGLFSGISLIRTGNIIRRASSVTPVGFLRCNGAWVSTTTFADLYAVIGDTFTNPLVIGSGQPWRQQYDINTSQSGGITGWTTGTPLPGALFISQTIVTRNRVYLLGGSNGISSVSTVFTAPINSDGTLGTWTTSVSLPGTLHASQAIVTRNRIFLLGGWATSIVYTTTINADGTLGTWTTSTPLPAALSHSSAIVTRNRVFLLGGNIAGIFTSTVYTTSINTDGTLGTWSTSVSLPGVLWGSSAIVTRNRVYLLGGGNAGGVVSTVFTAPINSDGTLGVWTTGTSLPAALFLSHAIVTRNRVFLLGGHTTTAVSTVYTAPINSDGTLGAWTTATSLPVTLMESSAIVTSSRVFLLGGNTGSAVSTVFTAPILGGLNDYSLYYDGSIEALRLTTFAIPDKSAEDVNGVFHYIKF